MSIEFTNDEERLLLTKPRLVINNDLARGGKGPPGTGNWLSGLECGDIFLARHIQRHEQNFELSKFYVILKTEKSVKLLVFLDDTKRMVRWVDAKTFSQEMIFQEVLANEPDLPLFEGE